MRLDTYFKKNKIKKIDFMKIDAEESDLECLKSLENTLADLNFLKLSAQLETITRYLII